MSRITKHFAIANLCRSLYKGVAVEFALSADGPMTPGEA
jgi:hypothetical protein